MYLTPHCLRRAVLTSRLVLLPPAMWQPKSLGSKRVAAPLPLLPALDHLSSPFAHSVLRAIILPIVIRSVVPGDDRAV